MPDHPAYRHDAPKLGYLNVLPADWTRSVQRVEGISVVVDIRRAESPMLEGAFLYAGTCNIGELPRGACPEDDRVSLLYDYIERHFPHAIDGRTLTMRIDSDVIRGVRDDVDLLTRALRSHLSGVRVEVMS